MTSLNQEEISKSIEKHLDSLKDTVKSALLAAIIFWWAGLKGVNPIKIFGMEVDFVVSRYFAVIFYLFVNLSVVDKLVRLNNLISLTDDNNLMKNVSKISLYPFFANPFSYFGNTLSSRFNSSKGFGVLIIVWWVCNSSLYSLSKNSLTFSGLILQGIFLLLGLSSIVMINRIFSNLFSRIKQVDEEAYNEIKKCNAERSIVTFLCIGVGGIFAYFTMMLCNV